MARLRQHAAWLLIAAAFLVIAGYRARTMHIWSNEAWFASPALTLLHHGYLGTTIFEPRGTWMEGIDRHTYWLPPVHLLAQTAWYAIVGFNLGALRWLSIIAGCGVLFAWYVTFLRLAANRVLAVLACAILAIDPLFVTFGVLGRADMLCAALGAASWAVYLSWREVSFARATLVAHSLAAVSCLTHPCGVLYAGGLLLLALVFDRSRLRWRTGVWIATPYVTGLAAWGVYIAQAPADFARQFRGNVSGIAGEFTTSTRWSGLAHPLNAIKREYVLRYGSNFGWFQPEGEHWHLVALAMYTAAVLAALAWPAIRQHRGYRALMILGAWDFLMLTFFDGLKGSAYLVHTLPLCAAFVAIIAVTAWRNGPAPARWAAAAGTLALMVGLGVSTAGYLAHPEGAADYEKAVSFLRAHTTPDRVIAIGEFAFALGFESGMVDDMRLGYYTGRRPQFVAANNIYRGWWERSRELAPEIHAYVERLMREEYRLAFRSGDYTIYERIVAEPGR